MIPRPLGADGAGAHRWHYALVFAMVLFSSGNPAVLPRDNAEITLIPATAALVIAFLSAAVRRVSAHDLIVFGVFAALTLFHLVSVPGASPVTAAGFFVRMFMGYAIVRLVPDAPIVLVRTLAAIAALAVGVFSVHLALSLVEVDLGELLRPVAIEIGRAEAVHAVFHNFNSELDRYRNAGLYWEPGALAGYSLLGLVLLSVCQARFDARERLMYGGALVLAVLSTFSTTGYVILPLVFMLYVLVRHGGRLTVRFAIAAVAFAPVLVATVVAIAELSFVRDKIEEQVFAVVMERGDWQLNRIGQFVSDMQDIAMRPLAGWGANPRLRPSAELLDEDVVTAQGNGLSNFLVKFGAIGLATFALSAGYALRRYSGVGGLGITLAVALMLLVLVGEKFLDYPLYLALMFAPFGSAVRSRRWLVVPLAPVLGAPRGGTGRVSHAG